MTRRGVEVQPLSSFAQRKRTHEGRADANAGEHVSVKINKTQYAIINSLREAGSFVPEAEVLPDTDLAEVLTNSGLDSAGLLVFKAALEKRLSLPSPIPVTALISAKTVRAVEVEIMKTSMQSNRGLLLPFATEGSKTPLFLFPPGGGKLNCWIELIRYLPNRPVYGLRLRGLQPGETAFESIDEMVRSYVLEIRRVKPRGPYALLGMCFGGNVAYEVAKELEHQGEVVEFTGGIDNAPYITQMSFAALRFFIIDLLATRRLITAAEQASLKQELHDADPATFPKFVMRRYRTRLQTVGITRGRLEAWYRVFSGTAHMADGYTPEGKIESYTSFWACPLPEWGISQEEWQMRIKGWEDLSHRTGFHFISGEHYTALSKEHVVGFQKVLNAELECRES